MFLSSQLAIKDKFLRVTNEVSKYEVFSGSAMDALKSTFRKKSQKSLELFFLKKSN